MSAPRPDPSGRGLDGLWDRIPVVDAVSVRRGGGLKGFRERWTVRSTVTLVLLAPAIFLAYSSVSPRAEAMSVLVTASMALTAALVLTSYLPTPGTKVPDSSCALMPALSVFLAGVLLGQGTAPFSGFAALALLVLGLWQRVAGYSACN